jgi:hypothetical protein
VNKSKWSFALMGTLLAAVAAAEAGAAAAGREDHREPLCVQVDPRANLYVEGVRVDTLLVRRRQWIHWEKRDPSDPDLLILFERELIHPRFPIRVVVSGAGKPARTRVHIRARMKTYRGKPEEGFADDLPGSCSLRLRVVPPTAP